ncbi:3-dehydroshikimate dehydratase protein [Rutstroemia sp. NJR-2017a BBW]|nr:3-dehydroshikimate dehydratase protein [Rutstroemia sp. NJR-2017a BBW]
MFDFKPAISLISLGRAWVHDIIPKLDAAAHHGLNGIEIFYEDIEYLTKAESKSDRPSTDDLLHAASSIRTLCDERGLTIISLLPFFHYEGLKDREEHAKRIEKMKLWFKLAKILGTDIIQIPANFLPKEEITDDIDVVVKDLQVVADMGAKEKPIIRFAYENLCWGTYFDVWEAGWDIVEKVDRTNFGVCLDTFHIGGRVYADPSSSDGKTPNAENDIEKSIKKLVERMDVNKVFYIQVVDAEKMRDPLVEGHAFWVDGQPARMSWSRNARLFAGEVGGYLPVEAITKAIIDGLGYKGWVSMELFNRSMSEEGSQVPDEHARRAAAAWEVIKGWINSWDKAR